MDTSILDRFYTTGVIPVLVMDHEKDALPLADALQAGGLPIAEITLRTPAALGAIRQIAMQRPDVLVGAGTVNDRRQAQAAVDAGAQFLVCPGMIEKVVLCAQKNQLPILAGAITPSEMIQGINLGLNVLKFFPAGTMGGLKAIKSMSDPFPQLRFIPTGGIRPDNVAEYLQMEKIHAVGGSWMAKKAMIAEGRFDEITRLSQEASEIVRKVRGNHQS